MIDFTLLGPLQLSLLALLAGLVTVALYLQRPRKRRVLVAELALWETLLAKKSGAALFSRLQHLGSLLLSLLIVLLLVLARGGPHWNASAGRHVVLLVDAGSHMRARDVSPSRLGAALEVARRLVDARAHGDEMLVAQLDETTTPLSPMTRDARVLHAALAQVEPTDTPSRLSSGLRFAIDALRGHARPEIVLLSDGVGSFDAALATEARSLGIALSQHLVGTRSRNVRVSALSARRYPLDPSQAEIMVEVENGSDQPLHATLTLRADGRALDVEPLELRPHARLRRFHSHVGLAGTRLEAHVAPARPFTDDLPDDDRLTTILPARTPRRVLAVTEGNRYLEAALLLDELLRVDRVTPANYTDAAGYDVVIFDAFAPRAPPGVPALYLAPPGGQGASPFAVTGTMTRPYVDALVHDHPLVRGLALRDVNIAEAQRVTALPGDQVLARTGTAPLLVAGHRQGRAIVALAFDVRRSDLPLRVAWPLLVLRSIEHLTTEQNASENALGRNHRAGEASLTPRTVLARAAIDTPPASQLLSRVREPWFWLAALAALLLVAEWCSHQRRLTQ